MSDDETRGEPLYITPEPWSPTHRCIPLARLAALEAAEARAEAAEKDAHEWQRAYAKAAENWECREEEHGRELAALHDAIEATCGNVGPETPEEAGKRLVARVRELEAKREAAEAQLAALREAAREMEERAGTVYEFASDSYPEDEEGRFLAAEKALAAALSDTAAAEAYTRRVRAEALREAAGRLDPVDGNSLECEEREDVPDWLRAEAERMEAGR